MPAIRIPFTLNAAAVTAIALVSLALQTTAVSAEADAAAAMRFLKKNCLSCHNEEKHKGGLVMASREGLLKDGEDGAAVVPGKPEESPIITSLAADADPHMPPKKQLPETQTELLKRWVQNGAPWDAAALAQASAPRAVALSALPAAYHPILAVSVSPDGKCLALGCGNEVVLYEIGSKEITFKARGSAHLDPVQAITWTIDGSRLITGAFRRVVIWDADSLAPKTEITSGLTDRITAIRCTPDGQQILLCDGQVAESGIVRVMDLATAAIVRSWTAHDDTIFDLAVSNDGTKLATAGGDKLVKIWDLATGKETARLEGHTAQVLSLAFNKDGTQLVTGGADQQLKVWDVATKEGIATLGTPSAAVNGVIWNAAAAAIFAVTEKGAAVRYTDIKSHTGAQSSESASERKFATADSTLYCVASTPDGERVFAGAHDGRVFGWNKDGKLVTTLEIAAAKTTAAVSAK